MFELIRANKRRSLVLVTAMLLVLLTLGFLIGSAVAPSITATNFLAEEIEPRFVFNPLYGLIGMAVAFVIWAVQAAVAYFQGDRILLAVSHARPIEKEDHPQLYNVVEEMSIAARLPKPPKVYIIEDMGLNAFATGRKPENAAVAVTAGLLGQLNRDELQGVVAHEISHIVNRDVLFMTMVGIMVGSILMISEVFLRGLFYSSVGGSGRYRSSNSRRSGGGGHPLQMALMVVAVVFAIVAPILAQVIYFACSRRREYLADASAAVYTRYPAGLASALEKIAGAGPPAEHVNRATAPMYIASPLKQNAIGAMNTHPPIHERVNILRGIAGGVSYRDYQAAWAKAGKGGSARVPNSALQVGRAAIRKPHPDAAAESTAKKKQNARQQMRQAGDVLRRINEFIFLSCVCGMRVKLPPEFKKDHVKCPRCKKQLEVPVAQLAVAGAVGEQLLDGPPPPPQSGGIPLARRSNPQPPLEIKRKPGEWMSFKCSCGAVKHLSPSFALDKTKCTECLREVHIRKA